MMSVGVRFFVVFMLLFCHISPAQKSRRLARMKDHYGCLDTVNTLIKVDGIRVVYFNDCVGSFVLEYRIAKHHRDVERNVCDSMDLYALDTAQIFKAVKELNTFFLDTLAEEQMVEDSLTPYVLQMVGYENHGRKMIRFHVVNEEEEDSMCYNRFLVSSSACRGGGRIVFDLDYDIEKNHFFYYYALYPYGERTIQKDSCSITIPEKDRRAQETYAYIQKKIRKLEREEIELFLKYVIDSNLEEIKNQQEKLLFKLLKKYPKEVMAVVNSFHPFINFDEIVSRLEMPSDNVSAKAVLKKVNKVVACGENSKMRFCRLLEALQEGVEWQED